MISHLITTMILIPMVGVATLALLPVGFSTSGQGEGAIAKRIAFVASFFASAIAVTLLFLMKRGVPELQAGETLNWIGSYSIAYEVGIDGLGALPLLLVAIVFPILIAFEWNQPFGFKGMSALFLVLQSALLGAICAQDLFLMYFFISMVPVPLYFLISIWGGKKGEDAAFSYVVASAIGLAFVLMALLLVYHSAEPNSFSLHELAASHLEDKMFRLFGRDLSVSKTAFTLVAAGLAIQIPIWPIHGWFIKVSEASRSSVFVVLSAIMPAVGYFVFVRLSYSLFPSTVHAFSGVIVAVGTVNLLVAAMSSVVQRDLRRLLANIALGGNGLVLTGIGSLNQAGIVGSLYEMLSLGLALAGFGLVTGWIDERTGVTTISKEGEESRLSGLVRVAPILSIVFAVMLASILGVPGFGGFVSLALLMIGNFSVHPGMAATISIATILFAYCLFSLYRAIFFGAGSNQESFKDLAWRERAYVFPIIIAIIFIGVYPKPLLEVVRPTALTLLSMVK